MANENEPTAVRNQNGNLYFSCTWFSCPLVALPAKITVTCEVLWQDQFPCLFPEAPQVYK